jgi:hypothetical protein
MWCICFPEGRQCRRVSTKTSDFGEAKTALLDYIAANQKGSLQRVKCADWYAHCSMVVKRKKVEAKRGSWTCSVNAGYLYDLLELSGFRCAVSGIEFDFGEWGQGRRNPWAPSLDRIDCREGYHAGNVRWVCLIANVAMSDWGSDVLLRLSNAVARCATALVVTEQGKPAKSSPMALKPALSVSSDEVNKVEAQAFAS